MKEIKKKEEVERFLKQFLPKLESVSRFMSQSTK